MESFNLLMFINNELRAVGDSISHAVFGDDYGDETNIIQVGWLLGVSESTLKNLIESLEGFQDDELIGQKLRDDVLPDLRAVSKSIREAVEKAINDEDEIEWYKLGWRLGRVSQMLMPTILWVNKKMGEAVEQKNREQYISEDSEAVDKVALLRHTVSQRFSGLDRNE